MKRLALIVLFGLLPLKALALTCTASVSDVGFGSVDVLSAANPLATSSGNVSITCTRALLSELFSGNVTACLHINAGSGGVNAGPTARQMALSSNNLLFNLYKDAARTTLWGSASVFTSTGPRKFLLSPPLVGLGSDTVNDFIYGSVNASQSSLPVGSYSSSFSGSHTELRFGYGDVACNTLSSSAVTAPFTATATITPNCTITAGLLDFGSAGLITANLDATSVIATTCTNAAAYQIALDNGSNYSAPNRRMANGGNRVSYALYRDGARTLTWGATAGSDTVSGTGTGSNVNTTVYGRVPAQAGIAIGNYTDTVVATISF